MLRKCLKYDLIPVARIWWIAAVTVLLLAVPVGLCLRDQMLHADRFGYVQEFRWSVFGPVIGSFGLAVFALLTVILTAARFYGNFFRDEGYLTFTLPVKRQTLFLSKLISGMVWVFGVMLVSVAAIAVAEAIAPSAGDHSVSMLQNAMKQLGEWFMEGHRELGIYHYIYLVELFALIVLGCMGILLNIYLCITIGSVLAKKNKLLAAVGTYYVFNAAATVAFYVGIFFVAVWALAGESAFPTAQLGNGSGALLLLLACVIVATVDAVLWLVNLGCLERKLNLA